MSCTGHFARLSGLVWSGKLTSVHDVGLPLHERVREKLAADVSSGAYPRGARLPSERELCSSLGVSRVTLRRGLAGLADDGLIVAAHGRGWFVVAEPLSEPANVLMSFSAMARGRGLVPSAKVLSDLTRPCTLDEAQDLRIAPGADIFDLRRLRLLDGIPVAVDRSRVPLSVVATLAEQDFTAGSLYSAFERAGVHPHRADYTVEAVSADAEQARLLGLEVGRPLLRTRQITYDSTGRVIELGGITYRGDRYRFQATLWAAGRT